MPSSSKMSLVGMQHDTCICNVVGGIPDIQDIMALDNNPFGVVTNLVKGRGGLVGGRSEIASNHALLSRSWSSMPGSQSSLPVKMTCGRVSHSSSLNG